MNNNMNILEIDINKLIFPKYNPRKKLKPEDKEYQKIKKSIEEFGYTDLVIINKDNTIISGNQRTQVLMDMGYKKIKVVQIDIDKTKEKALNIALNKITGEWDYAMLGDLLLDLDEQNYDLEITGFDLDEIEEIMAPLGLEEEKEVIEDDFDCTPPEEPKAKYGDIYQLGNHKLMCGDSTKEEDVAKLMNGVKADMVFTDPPYGVSYEGGLNERKKQQIKNDNVTGNNLYIFLCKVFRNAKKNTNNKCAFYVFYATKTTKEFINAFLDSGLKQRSIIAWYKQGGGFGDFMAQYMNAYEPCIYGSNGDSVNWYGPTNEKTIWEMSKEKKCNLHPTMKPIELVSRAIKNSSKKNNIVLDLFGGSGSTLIACEQLNRKCYMMELDEHYIDVIINRWETFTGKKAVKIEGEK